MFSKLRINLTLTNVIVFSIIFIIFIMSIFIVMEEIINDQTHQITNMIFSSSGINNTSTKNGHDRHQEHQLRYFYIKSDNTGKIISTSTNLSSENLQLDEILSKALATKKNDGVIELDEEYLHFSKRAIENGTQTFISFVNTHAEHEMLNKLLIVLILAGLGGLCLVFFGSLYMANRSLIPIKEAWKRQKDFVADASHELRTPLSVIETTVDLLAGRKEYTIDSQIKWIENIQTENKRMSKLVSDLLLLARADSEQNSIELKTFSLHSALLEVYIPFEAIALQKGIYLQTFSGDPIDFYGDEAKLKQLAVILVDNAIKYTSSGGSVGMKLKNISDSIEISVFDTGEGISEEHVEKIFQRFFRVDKSRSRKEGSVGLGLSIAEWIVKQHNGHIKVESIKGKGTTFRIFLPKLNL
ncbi:MAG: HAMP domain-containing sensor histidine kinase [Bacillota bacterium]|nr:HAMP domain-containing sensor histidine kinase [Bacillota bacterium]